MKLKDILVVVIAVVVSIIGATLFVEDGKPGKPGEPGRGAVVGPEVGFDFWSVNGVQTWYARNTSLTAASTTVCALRAPAATSTLSNAAIKFTTGSTSALQVGIGIGSTRYATTSNLTTVDLSAGAQGVLQAPDFEGGSFDEAAAVISPNEYLVFQAFPLSGAADGIGNLAPQGVCQGVFDVI